MKAAVQESLAGLPIPWTLPCEPSRQHHATALFS
jgi:hypothetical protein